MAWVDAGAIPGDKSKKKSGRYTRGSSMRSSSDTSVASVAVKSCCSCGSDVTGQPRMKDSQGRYWCGPCGQADQRRKAMTATTANCAGCHKPFPKGKLDKHGEHFFCKACLKKRTKTPSAVAPATAGAPAAAAASGTVTSLSAIISSAAAASTSSSAGAAAHGGGSGDQRRVIVMSSMLGALVLVWILITFVWT